MNPWILDLDSNISNCRWFLDLLICSIKQFDWSVLPDYPYLELSHWLFTSMLFWLSCWWNNSHISFWAQLHINIAMWSKIIKLTWNLLDKRSVDCYGCGISVMWEREWFDFFFCSYTELKNQLNLNIKVALMKLLRKRSRVFNIIISWLMQKDVDMLFIEEGKIVNEVNV